MEQHDGRRDNDEKQAAGGGAVSWTEFAKAAPELSARIKERFARVPHHVLATLRKEGAPRVSGTEAAFSGDELTLGSMPGAVKAHDLQRDGRFALHAAPCEVGPDGGLEGDAKVSGVAVEVTDPAEIKAHLGLDDLPGPLHLFLLRLTGAVVTSVENERLVIRSWTPGRGTAETSRA